MHNTRQEILNILKSKGPATVRELAQAVGVTPMSVRHHLQGLREEGAVALAGQAQPARVGRPQQIYAVVPSPSSPVDLDYRLLLASLLEEAQALLGEEAFRSWLLAAADRRVADKLDSLTNMPLERRIREVTAYLSRHGHLASWEHDGDGFAVHCHNCPFHPLARTYPELCQMDAALISGLLGQPVEQTAAIPKRDGRCTFHLVSAPTWTESADAPGEGV